MLPAITECKSLDDVRAQSKAIAKMATDIVAEPIVQEGYMRSGQSGHTASINVMSMARGRLRAVFPTADFKDPLFERLFAEAKYICAECIRRKYECRARCQKYDHIKDATLTIAAMLQRTFKEASEHIKAIENNADKS